jgi:small-conductance mechanosensitive channel
MVGRVSAQNGVIGHCRKRSFNWLSSLEEINFEIKQRFESEGIAMAYPTQTVYQQ